ncbi:hypothetical protein GUITHDRAFT_143546 [Guillardia theta CCMP2712]|uniref:Uncharacterized protein n=1 Tax=Guillardia theta (strain CCMP2712) TaxID=905079 RepID=L1ITD1_GUITC|nr:hypothetical protein GUITHDRAFT_143546 [Guillardia theta CCMP2712]EKX39342.1 hypothetical protein GUITHDRAFT_143546 [Guillardia theta CCMP2712]|eukprot:XP_005826322.1 hypothetical protein GUITHDRAFT_143546 [Guillardia theta CCMP2712]
MKLDYGALGWLIMCLYHYGFPIYFAVAWARVDDADRLWKTGPAGDSTNYRLMSGYIIVLWVLNFLNSLFLIISIFDERRFQIFRWFSLILNTFGLGALEVAGIMIIDQVFPYRTCAELGFFHGPEKSLDACYVVHIICWMVFITNVIVIGIVVLIVPAHLIIGNDFGFKVYRIVMGSSLARAFIPAVFLPAEEPTDGQQPTTEQQKLEAGYPMATNIALEQAVQPSTIPATYPPVSPSNVPVMLGSA